MNQPIISEPKKYCSFRPFVFLYTFPPCNACSRQVASPHGTWDNATTCRHTRCLESISLEHLSLATA